MIRLDFGSPVGGLVGVFFGGWFLAVTPANAQGPVPAATVWRGKGSQFNPTGARTVALAYVGGAPGAIVGAIAYPSLRCGGTLTLDEFGPGSTNFIEHITFGSCLDSSRIAAQPGSSKAERLDWRWARPNGPVGTASLGRLDDGGTGVPASLGGIWEGWVYQYDSAPHLWSALIAIAGGSVGGIGGTSAYPALECGGGLTLRAASTGRLEVRETLWYGTTQCADGMVLSLTSGEAADGLVVYRALLGPGGLPVAVGVLQRSGGKYPAAPAAPSDLRVEFAGAGHVDLAWTDHATNESGFVIERTSAGAGLVPIAVVGPGVTAFRAVHPPSGDRSVYSIRALNAGGVSSPSNRLSVTRGKSRP